MNRALAVDELGFGLELLAADAIQAFVEVLVDVPVVVDLLEEPANEPLVSLIARTDEEVRLGVQARSQIAPDVRDPVDVLLRRQTLLHRDAIHLRGVLVDAGEEEGLVASLPAVPDEDVGGGGRVRVADVRRSVHVVDRRRQVVLHRKQ